MSNPLVDKVGKILEKHEYLNLATVSSDGQPSVHTMAYGSDGTTVYFFTDKTSRKVKHIEGNSKVAYTVDDDHYEDMMKMVALQMEGVAKLVTDKKEAEKATGLVLKKFPMMAKMPPNPNNILMKVEAKQAWVMDNAKGFGHRDVVKF